MTAKEILSELKSLGSEATKKTLLRHGAREPVFGVKVGDLKKIQKRIKKDHQLALDLYATGNFDAMYLAALVADDEKMTKKDLRAWVKGAYGGWLPAYCVPWVAAGSAHGWDLAQEWMKSKNEMIAGAGWWTICSLVSIKPDEELDLPALKKLIKRVEKEIHQERNHVREAMNDFLIAVGAYVASLTETAVQAGHKIGPVQVDHGDTACGTPFVPDAIAKVQKRSSIGKKRKSAKC